MTNEQVNRIEDALRMAQDNMSEKRSISEILDDMRSRGDVSAHFANELEEAINREFAEFASELKRQVFVLLGETTENKGE